MSRGIRSSLGRVLMGLVCVVAFSAAPLGCAENTAGCSGEKQTCAKKSCCSKDAKSCEKSCSKDKKPCAKTCSKKEKEAEKK